MQVITIRVILMGAIFASGSCATSHAQNATMTDSEACSVVLSYLSGGGFVRDGGKISGLLSDKRIMGAKPTPSGIRLQVKGRPVQEVLLDYKDFSEVISYDGFATTIAFEYTETRDQMLIDLTNLHGCCSYKPKGVVNERLIPALNRLVADAHVGHPYDCTSAVPPADAAKELADFQEKAAAWRVMNPKPPVSDEVTKKRLLAEDAVQEKNFSAAGDFYRDGIAIDPTWAPGWYNAALISAELKNYAAAANYMKHYLILVPDASDATAAKEKVLLWEAKAEQTSRK